MTDVINHEWPELSSVQAESRKTKGANSIMVDQMHENLMLKAENERLRIALIDLERLAREALGG